MSLVFNGISTIDNVVFNGNPVEHIIYNGVEIWGGIDYGSIPMTFEILTNGTWTMTAIRKNHSYSSQTSWSIEYSINGGSHVTISGNAVADKTIATLSAGDIVTVYNLNRNYYQPSGGSQYYSYISMTCDFNVYGNLALTVTNMTSRCCHGLFTGNTHLLSCEHFILHTTLADNCYTTMFMNCTNLTHPPILPATTLATNCYYSLFYGCTNLLYAPALPAITLLSGCYTYLFYNCTKINEVTCLATNPSTSYTTLWLSGAASTGTITIKAGTTWASNSSGIPASWTIIEV